jgi:hypothetical protein
MVSRHVHTIQNLGWAPTPTPTEGVHTGQTAGGRGIP